MQSKHVCLAFLVPTALVLHGCGGGGDSPSPKPGSSTSSPPDPADTTTASGQTTPGPSPAPPAPPTPWDAETAVSVLNSMYMGFDETDDTSPLGVTISMAGQTSSFNANLFCTSLMGTSCYDGQADCRMSASIFNHKVLVDGSQFAPTMDRPVGYVFNQHLTETFWGKCAYIWDGADSKDLNSGCGAGATGGGCGDPNSAFENQCGDAAPKHNCSRDDVEVTGRLCSCASPLCEESYGVVAPPALPQGETCFYEMPALVYGESTDTNHLRDMLKQRVTYQGDDETLTAEWNEVVIDDRLLIPKIRTDPTDAIWAFVCVPSDANPNACALATEMRDDFQTTYAVSGSIPVVALDVVSDFIAAGGPFGLPDSRIIV